MKMCIVVKNNCLLIKAGLVTLCKGVLPAYATHHGVVVQTALMVRYTDIYVVQDM